VYIIDTLKGPAEYAYNWHNLNIYSAQFQPYMAIYKFYFDTPSENLQCQNSTHSIYVKVIVKIILSEIYEINKYPK
jgi:hypothetical protein